MKIRTFDDLKEAFPSCKIYRGGDRKIVAMCGGVVHTSRTIKGLVEKLNHSFGRNSVPNYKAILSVPRPTFH